MKIVFITDPIWPFTVGGSEIQNYEIYKRLAEKGHDVHICGLKRWSGESTVTIDGITMHGVAKHRDIWLIGPWNIILNQTILSVKVFFWLLNKKFDVIDVAHFVFLNCYAAKCAAFITRTPLVFTWQQHFGKEYLGGMLGNTLGAVTAAFEKPTVRFSPFNIASSEVVRHDLIKAGMPAENTEVIYNGIDIRAIQEAEPLRKKRFDVIFVGRLVYQKNPELLIRAVRLLIDDIPDLTVCILGGGYQMPKLLHIANTLDVKEYIDFVGEIKDRKKVFQYMKSSKVFVLPSLFEGFPLTTIEAGACGLPIIVAGSKWNRTTDFVNGNGLISEATPEALAQAITRLLNDEHARKQMGEKGGQIARGFDFDALATQTEKYYEKAIKYARKK